MSAPRRAAAPGPVTALRLWLALWTLVATATAAALCWLFLGFGRQPGPGDGREVVLEAPAELGLAGSVARLEAMGATEHPRALLALLRLLDAGPTLRTTHIPVSAAMSAYELLPRLLTDRGAPVLRLTFPEGWTRHDFAHKLGKFGVARELRFLSASSAPHWLRRLEIPGDSAEGYLFPDTYQFRVGSGAPGALQRFVRTFRRRMEPLLEQRAEALDALRHSLGFDVHDVVILASVVEKEARLPGERATIAGVFLNRLRDPGFRPHRLQADPTVAYGCLVAPERAPTCAGFDGLHVTPAMVRDPANPYNTYRHDGLPPGPICSPGLESIRAVLEAEQHEYFYFVARGDGSHVFSRTLEEHNQAIARGRDGR